MKRRLSFYLALLFALTLLFGSLPEGLLEVKAAPTTIASGYVSPEIPSPGGSYSGSVSASLCPAVDSPFTVKSAYWYNGKNQDSGGIGLAPSTFLPGGEYFMEFTLSPKEGYTFSPSTVITVEHMSVSSTSYNSSNGELYVSTNNIQLAGIEISEVTAELLIPSPGGYWAYSTPIDLYYADDSHFSLQDDYWFNAKDQSTGKKDTCPQTFENGCEYYASFFLKPDSGYEFASEPSIDLETIGIRDWELLPSGNLYIETETVTLTYDISIVIMTITVPSAGGTFAGPEAEVKPDKDQHFTVKDSYWYNAEAQESGAKGIAPSSFTPGGKYYAQFTLVPESGYAFIYGTSIALDGADFESAILQADGTIIITTEVITLSGSSGGSGSESSESSKTDSEKTESGEKSGESSEKPGESSGENTSGESSGSSGENSSGEKSGETSQTDPGQNTNQGSSALNNLVVILLAVLIPLLIAVIVIIVVMLTRKK